jgi:hypothetical protein
MSLFEMFARKAPADFAPWSDAPPHKAQGYAVLPVEKQQAARGPCFASPASYETPAGGGWGWGLGEPSSPQHFVVAIQCGILPRTGGVRSLADCAATWCPVVRVTGAGKRTARAIAALAPGALVRLDLESGDVLAVFKTGEGITDPRQFDLRINNVSCDATGAFLVASPRHEWLNEKTPANTHRDELPPLSWSGASELVRTIDGLLRAKAA